MSGDRGQEWRRIDVMPPWQEEKIREAARRAEELSGMNQDDWNGLRGVSVSLQVAAEWEYDKKKFDLYENAVHVWDDVHLGNLAGIYLNHDGRNRDMQSVVRSKNCKLLVISMARMLLNIMRLVSRGHTGAYVEALVFCAAGRHRSLSLAVWMAKIAALMNINFSVYLQWWNYKKKGEKTCSCWRCEHPIGLQYFHLIDAHRVIDMLALQAAGEDVVGCPFPSDEGERALVRRTAGTLLRYVRQVEFDVARRLVQVHDEGADGEVQVLGNPGPESKKRRYAEKEDQSMEAEKK